MKFFTGVLVTSLLLVSGVCATDRPTAGTSEVGGELDPAVAAKVLQSFPQCGVGCLITIVPKSTCGFNTTCVCHDATLQKQIAGCLSTQCTKLEALAARNASATMCHEPVRDKRLEQALVSIVGCGVTLIIFLIRISFILFSKDRELAWDDYAIIVAMAATLHYYIAEIIYFIAQGFAKVALCLFMLRIFPKKNMRVRIYVVCGLVCAYMLAFIIATLLQCQPIGYFWKQLDDKVEGKCNDVHLQAWISAGINIGLDVIIIALPIKSLWAMQASLAKKITAICMFSLGALVTIISILRLQSLISFSKSVNVTWEGRKAGSWSLAELYVAIICTCLPTIRIMVMKFGTKKLGWTAGSSNGPSQASAKTGYVNFRSQRSNKSATTSNLDFKGADFIMLNDVDSVHSKRTGKAHTDG
ncbi:CFEM domain-containing protein [Colletotrichum incanum]|nr:CFEM domain-containing protein [Colletotrichum incanum]